MNASAIHTDTHTNGCIKNWLVIAIFSEHDINRGSNFSNTKK